MIFNENDNSLTICRGDYGVPVIFSTEGFSVGEKIIFVFITDAIPDKIFTVNSGNYSFPLLINKTEAEALFEQEIGFVPYSVKRYSEEGEFLETLFDSKLLIRRSLIWQG